MITYFAKHPVAANLLMLLMVLVGVWGLQNINVQIDPDVEFNYALIETQWPGASAEDIESRVTVPFEQVLASLSGLRSTLSESREGVSTLTLEFDDNVDMNAAMRAVESLLSTVRSLPLDARSPVVSQMTHQGPVASLLISGLDYNDVADAAHEIEDELRERGIDGIETTGLKSQEITIEIPTKTLYELNSDIVSLSEKVVSLNTAVPAGVVGSGERERRLRGETQWRSVEGFEDLVFRRESDAGIVRLGDVANIEKQPAADQPAFFNNGNSAVELKLYRDVNTDTFAAAAILDRWAEDFAAAKKPGIDIKIFREQWHFIRDQVSIMLKNGFSGLVLVFVTLTMFLRLHVAFSVALGIPVTFMAGIGLFYLTGGAMSITAIVALILALGVVVDDAIVVSEQAATYLTTNNSADDAVVAAAGLMAKPVISSSFTTMAAFAPLLIVGGPMAAIIVVIPTVLLCVIVASLIECFLILPNHLKSTWKNPKTHAPNRLRQIADNGFISFRERLFAPLLGFSLSNRRITLATAIALWLLSISLVGSGQVKLDLTTGISREEIHVNIKYVPNITPDDKVQVIEKLEQTLAEASQAWQINPVATVVVKHNKATFDRSVFVGDQYASIELEMISPDERAIGNADFLANWQANIGSFANVERFETRITGGHGNGLPEVTFTVTGDELADVRNASNEIAMRLRLFDGVENADHDLARMNREWVLSLNAEGLRLGLTTEQIARQLRASYDGYTIQTFIDKQEVTVKMMLPPAERNNLASLRKVAIPTKAGLLVALETVAEVSERSAVSTIKHINGQIGAYVNADIDTSQVNARDLVAAMFADTIPTISEKYDVQITLGSLSADKEEQLVRLQYAACIALAFIYIVLAWLSSSYLLPLAVVATIPLGLSGAIAGHWIMGLDFTVMSILGMFALSGIVVNDAIILIASFRSARTKGKGIHDALMMATCDRLRAVILTSLTTIAGLAALLFERSEVSNFVLAMPVTICFGLAFATGLTLFVIPCLLSVIASMTEWTARRNT